MTGDGLSRIRRTAVECILGGLVLAPLTLISAQLGLGLATAGLLTLAAIGLLSLRVSLTSAIILCLGSILLLDHYFLAPVTVVRSSLTRNIVLSLLFPTIALLLSWLVRNVRRQTAALRESEAHWKEIFEQNPTMYFLIDANGVVQSVNEFGASQLGYAVGELVGKPVRGLFHEADRELVRSNLAACQQTPGQSSVWEVRKLRKDGSVLWVRENAKFVQWGANDPIFLVSCEDITQRRTAEEAARRTQDNLLEAQRLGRIGSWSVDVSAGVNGDMTASPEMLRMFGLDPEKDELTQDLLIACIHPDDRPFMDAIRAQRVSAQADYEYEYRIVLPDGAIRRLHSISHPVTGEDGALLEHIGTTMDVTERAEAEEAVRRSEASLQEAQRLGRMGSWSQEVSSGVMSGTPELYRIFGLDPEEVSLSRELLSGSFHPEDRAAVIETIERGRRSREAIEVDHRIVLPDGSIRHVHGVSRPVFGEAGDVVRYIGTVMDVTELRKAEEALRQAYADLTRVSRITSIGALTASLAHEINQPIGAAVANANACLRWLAADAPDLEEVRAAAAAIVKNGTRAAEIVARTRRLFEKGAPQSEPIDVDDVVRETVALLSGETTRHAVSIRTSLATGLPQIQADRVQLQQVLMNLILNGIDAMESVVGAREITIASQMNDEAQIMISVADAGAGLAPELAEKLFDTFFTTKPHGTGMGLSISRSIISAHGGRLWAEPNEPRGALFRFTLPTAASQVTA
jgi:PAS domain S-box-containing protein